MDIRDYSPSPTARRFESGTPPVPAIYAGIAGIELMQEIGVAETRAHVSGLNQQLLEGARRARRDGRDAARPRAARSARLRRVDGRSRARRGARQRRDRHELPRREPPDLGARYNTSEDVATLLAALERHRALLA